MWVAVDRIEGNTVVLVSDEEKIFHVAVADYKTLTALSPQESHILQCEIRDGHIISARYDPHETDRRLAAARARLQRLINKNNGKG